MNEKELEVFRQEAALEILVKMIDNGGERESKVNAAVDYANKLVERLITTYHQKLP
jgi:hypothetical protein